LLPRARARSLNINTSPRKVPEGNQDLRRLVDEGHPSRAQDMKELRGLQKTTKPKDGERGHPSSWPIHPPAAA
jgi:hypothetical protein